MEENHKSKKTAIELEEEIFDGICKIEDHQAFSIVVPSQGSTHFSSLLTLGAKVRLPVYKFIDRLKYETNQISSAFKFNK